MSESQSGSKRAVLVPLGVVLLLLLASGLILVADRPTGGGAGTSSAQVSQATSTSATASLPLTSSSGAAPSSSSSAGAGSSVSSSSSTAARSSSASSSSASSPAPATSRVFYRPVIARVYSFNQWTLPEENASTVGAALASLKPSFVSGLIRFEGDNLTASQRMVHDYATIRGAVLSTSPGAKFDLWLRATQFNSSESLVSAMRQLLSSGISFDAFSFDSLSSLSPDEQTAILSEAHGAGMLIGGSWAGTTPPAVTFDYLVTSDDFLQIHPASLSQIESFGVPVMLLINNGPTPIDANNQTEHYDWNFVWTDQQRSTFLTEAAQNQSAGGFYFMYPAFWPAGSVTPPTYWDSLKDDSMLGLMQSLIQEYNSQPPPAGFGAAAARPPGGALATGSHAPLEAVVTGIAVGPQDYLLSTRIGRRRTIGDLVTRYPASTVENGRVAKAILESVSFHGPGGPPGTFLTAENRI